MKADKTTVRRLGSVVWILQYTPVLDHMDKNTPRSVAWGVFYTFFIVFMHWVCYNI